MQLSQRNMFLIRGKKKVSRAINVLGLNCACPSCHMYTVIEIYLIMCLDHKKKKIFLLFSIGAFFTQHVLTAVSVHNQ